MSEEPNKVRVELKKRKEKERARTQLRPRLSIILNAVEVKWLVVSVSSSHRRPDWSSLEEKLQADAGLHTFTRSHLDTARFDYNLALSTAEQLH